MSVRVPRVHIAAIPLFGPLRDHSPVPIDIKVDARRGGQGRPSGRHEAALPWTGASTVACLARSVARVVPLVLLLTASGNAASAEDGPIAFPAIRQGTHPFTGFIDEAAQRFAIPSAWIRAVLSVESAGDVHARSPKGAIGLMQIMPATWGELRKRYSLGSNPYDPHDNILAGAAYLRELLDRYGSPGMFAAYNAGPSRYEALLAGDALPAETQAYVAKLATLLGIELPATRTAGRRPSTAETLFVAWVDLTRMRDRSAELMPSSGAKAAISVHDVSPMVPRPIGVFVPGSKAGGSQ
ncbi:hypothetical protein ACVIWU_006104 [Bradyrhizobium sp. USDA 4509]